MLKIDDLDVSQALLLARKNAIHQIFSQTSPKVKRLAVCTDNVLDWLCLALFCQDNNIALAPIHMDTPLVAAQQKAMDLCCDFLWWKNADGLQRLAIEDNQIGKAGVLIQSSSGTTGVPKMIERTWNAIAEEISSYNAALNLSSEVVPVLVCSITHSYGLICGVLASLARGAMPHVLTSWNPKYVMRILKEYSSTILYSSPTFLHSLVQLYPKEHLGFAVMTSGSLLPEPWFKEIRPRFRHFFQQYGCSEVGCISIAKNPDCATNIGYPLPYLTLECVLLENHESNQRLGELIVHQKGNCIATQDLVYQDTLGAWHFCSRQDDTIIVSGMNVYPGEVENGLSKIPSIFEVVVYRKEDGLVGQRVAAIFTADRDISIAEMRSYCSRFLARHQWPTYWQRVTHIPRNATGKISRKILSDIDFSSSDWQMPLHANSPKVSVGESV